jgi:hypothetical protein
MNQIGNSDMSGENVSYASIAASNPIAFNSGTPKIPQSVSAEGPINKLKLTV